MDEPLSNLNAKLRVQVRSEIIRLHKNNGATTIYVTRSNRGDDNGYRIVIMKMDTSNRLERKGNLPESVNMFM